MQSIRLGASALTALLLLALCALLWRASFAMPAVSPDAGLGRGALPQFCVVAGAVLAVAVFIKDLLAWRATGAIAGPFEVDEGAEPRRVVMVGAAALLLLTAYVAGWIYIGFLPATIAFLLVVSLMLLPRGRAGRTSVAAIAATSVMFGIGVWALFVYVLEVPLR